LRGELLGGVRARNPPDAHTEEMSSGRIVILNKNRLIVREQAVAQAFGIRAVGKCADLHGEISNRGIRTGEQFDAHGSSAGADHVQRHGRGAR